MNLVNEIHYYMIKRSERFSPKKKKKSHTQGRKNFLFLIAYLHNIYQNK